MESYRLQAHTLTLLESYRFENNAGRGHSWHSVPPKSLRYNLCADPYPLNLYGAIFYKDTVGRGVLVPSRPRNSFPCHRSETPRAITFVSLPQALHGRAFVELITCPEGVHRTYYWSRQPVSPSYFQATVPSFPSTLFCVGGCDG